MSRFLIAASALSLASAAPAATSWIPTSPLVQIGDDLDIFTDSSLAVETTDNLYSQAAGRSATFFTISPGITLEYGRETGLEVILLARRGFVEFTDSALRDLDDQRDFLSGKVRFSTGGPLTISLDSSYRETARNDDLASQGITGAVIGANLLRQANYSHALDADYRLSEKVQIGVGVSRAYNHYKDPTVVVNGALQTFNTNALTETDVVSVPVDIEYQAFEKLWFGFRYLREQADYEAAPYFDSSGALRPALPGRLTKDFYGLTTRGQLTESGKLNATARVGWLQFQNEGAASDSVPSWSVSLNHVLTERLSHNLTLSRDVTASSTGGQNDSTAYTYGLTMANAIEGLSLNLSVTRNETEALNAGVLTPVDTMVYTLGADFKYNENLTFNAGYNFTDSRIASNPDGNFNSNTFTLSAAFRY
ncbi:MAG: hypothetical protein RL646_1755 [Verrucomicrobiota bacterium]|jgi:hypothetical protein